MYLAEDVVNMETGEIYAEAGEEIDEELIEALRELGFKSNCACWTSTTSMSAPTSATR
jgi:hypothetical protein